MVNLTAQLPDPSGLRGAASQLRDAAGQLSAQASVTHGVLAAVGPAVWTDSSSDRVRGLLSELAGELNSGYAALSQSADALDSLASYVSSHLDEYEEAGRELEEMLRDPASDLSHGKLTEAERLVSERETIEWSVRAAMGQASDTIMAAVGLADRYHGGGQSFWSRAEQYLGWTAEELAPFVSGVWDGGVGVVKGVVGIAVTAAKLNPARLLVDPAGYYRDEEHAVKTIVSTVQAIVADPRQFGEDLLNLQELKKNPEHWLGELIPTVALTFAGLGAGAAGKAADLGEAADAATGAADTAAEAASAARAGRVVTAFTVSRELLEMDPEERSAYVGQVIRDTNYAAPKITERPVKMTPTATETINVNFDSSADFSWSPKQLDHVLTPDRPGVGGHSYATFNSVPDRIHTEFPPGWYPEKIASNAYEVVQNPDSTWVFDAEHSHTFARYNVTGTVDGVRMQVTVEPYGTGIVTAYPVPN